MPSRRLPTSGAAPGPSGRPALSATSRRRAAAAFTCVERSRGRFSHGLAPWEVGGERLDVTTRSAARLTTSPGRGTGAVGTRRDAPRARPLGPGAGPTTRPYASPEASPRPCPRRSCRRGLPSPTTTSSEVPGVAAADHSPRPTLGCRAIPRRDRRRHATGASSRGLWPVEHVVEVAVGRSSPPQHSGRALVHQSVRSTRHPPLRLADRHVRSLGGTCSGPSGTAMRRCRPF